MTNLVIEILFWVILITYVGARLNQTKKDLKQQH